MIHVAELEALAQKFESEITSVLSPTQETVERYRTMSLNKLRQAKRGGPPFTEAVLVHTRLGVAGICRAGRTLNERGLTTGVGELAQALLILSRSDRLSIDEQVALLRIAQRVMGATGGRLGVRDALKRREKELAAEGAATPSMLIREQTVLDLVDALRKTLHPTDMERIEGLPAPGPLPIEGAAQLLADAAGANSPAAERPSGDLAQAEVRITQVSLTNFRGIAGNAGLSLVGHNGRPVSALIYGSNGSGKSSFVDGIEMALQGRVGRSSNFDSSLFPYLRNLAQHDDFVVEVELSDGTSVGRRLAEGPGGFSTSVGPPISPGFQWAPLTLKRSDIMRFLDTEALARGTVLFDYFPRSAGSMGRRPDEALRDLEEERHRRRIERQALTRRLARKSSLSACGTCRATAA